MDDARFESKSATRSGNVYGKAPIVNIRPRKARLITKGLGE
jgi:hypothetical protein